MSELVEKAGVFAERAHTGQTRRYNGEPYVNHPRRVAEIVKRVTDDPEVIAAALIHDVFEDTEITLEEIAREFGDTVASYVDDVTNRSRPEDGNRRARVAIDIEHLKGAHPNSKTIKLADILDNLSDIVLHDLHFAKKYCREKEDVLNQALHDGNHELRHMLSVLIASIKVAAG